MPGKNYKELLISLCDQGVYSVSNYLFGLLVFKLLGLELYGEFAVLYSIFLLCMSIYYAIVIEPVSVLGVGKSIKQKENYIFYTIIYCIAVLFALSILLVCGELIFQNGKSSFGSTIQIALIIAIFSNFLLVLLKRLSYNFNRQNLSLIASLWYFVILFTSYLLIYLNKDAFVTLDSSLKLAILFGCISLSSCLGMLPFLSYSGKVVLLISSINWKKFIKISRFNLSIARWMFLNAIIIWLSKYFFSNYIGYKQGFEKTGVIRLGENLFLPIEQLITVIGVLTLPKLIGFKNSVESNDHLKRLTKILIGLVLFYTILVLLFLAPITSLLFDKSVFSKSLQGIVLSFGIMSIARILADFYLGLQFRVDKKHHYLFLSNTLSFLLSIAPSIYLIREYGIMGVANSLLLISVFQVATSATIRFYVTKRSKSGVLC